MKPEAGINRLKTAVKNKIIEKEQLPVIFYMTGFFIHACTEYPVAKVIGFHQTKFMRVIRGILFFFIAVPGLNSYSRDIPAGTIPVQEKKELSDSIPRYPDLYYEFKISELNKTSPVELEFNINVKKYIELYTVHRRQELARIIGLSQLYFPIFDEALDRNSLPLELKYLTLVESGLNPMAVSKSGAVGLWQFLMGTGRMFELEITSYVDERMEPYKSTEAACKYLKYLYQTFNNWHLVLSSYNGGPGETRKAIERSKGETDYWKLRPYLSEQAKNYVPAFIAMVYLFHYYSDHNIIPVKPAYNYDELDTLQIQYAVSFQQISRMIGMPIEQIRFLNPVYKKDYIPELGHPSVLVLPAEKVILYLQNEVNILGSFSEPEDYLLMVKNAGSTENKVKIVHVVEKGEFFHKIALKYECTIENIKAWNNLNDLSLYPGQVLIIWVDKTYQQP
jgi:membrane-bound lytic murein transglycosylase D